MSTFAEVLVLLPSGEDGTLRPIQKDALDCTAARRCGVRRGERRTRTRTRRHRPAPDMAADRTLLGDVGSAPPRGARGPDGADGCAARRLGRRHQNGVDDAEADGEQGEGDAGDRELALRIRADAHNQIKTACETCRAASIFASAAAILKAMNAADDSHDRKLLRGLPRRGRPGTCERPGRATRVSASPAAPWRAATTTTTTARFTKTSWSRTPAGPGSRWRPAAAAPLRPEPRAFGFAIDALADAGLIARNFVGKSALHAESIDRAVRRAQARTVDRPPSHRP